MIYTVNLIKTPNQELNFVVGDNVFFIKLRTIQNITYMSCWVNNNPIFYNQICTPNNWVNQYKYISVGGKFYFKCVNDDYPYYDKFGDSQELLFYTQDEIQ